jgi:hypothetical protein
VLINEEMGADGNPWDIRFMTMFNMTTASHLFLDNPCEECYPLYEGKMFHQYDHRWATYGSDGKERDVTVEEKKTHEFEVTPQYWLPEKEILNRIANVPDSVRKAWYDKEEHQLRDALAMCEDSDLRALATVSDIWRFMDRAMDERSPKWLLGLRNISNATNVRTIIASILPRSAVNHKATLIITKMDSLLLLGFLNSIVLDFCARLKVGGTDIGYFHIRQFPLIAYEQIPQKAKDYLIERIEKLVTTSSVISHILHFPIETWNDDTRKILSSEIDSLCARLYGLNREDLIYILDPESVMGEGYPSQTFPLLKKNELRDYGEYRTMRLILEAWDRQEQEPELWQ